MMPDPGTNEADVEIAKVQAEAAIAIAEEVTKQEEIRAEAVQAIAKADDGSSPHCPECEAKFSVMEARYKALEDALEGLTKRVAEQEDMHAWEDDEEPEEAPSGPEMVDVEETKVRPSVGMMRRKG